MPNSPEVVQTMGDLLLARASFLSTASGSLLLDRNLHRSPDYRLQCSMRATGTSCQETTFCVLRRAPCASVDVTFRPAAAQMCAR